MRVLPAFNVCEPSIHLVLTNGRRGSASLELGLWMTVSHCVGVAKQIWVPHKSNKCS